ncbi:Myb-Binding Protein 1A [Manis pentadactyla]|nr:Myb-Binding Protein 1A [Manis pentadactyla]
MAACKDGLEPGSRNARATEPADEGTPAAAGPGSRGRRWSGSWSRAAAGQRGSAQMAVVGCRRTVSELLHCRFPETGV